MDKIQMHEDKQQVTFLYFLQQYWGKNLSIPFPKSSKGKVEAEINHGRWLVQCPNGCGEATIVSEKQPIYICVNCGSPENDGQFYNIVFPEKRAKIEELLLIRLRANRNWQPRETVEFLEDENRKYLRGDK